MNFWEFLNENFIWIVTLLILGVAAYCDHTENMAKIQKEPSKAEQTVK